MSLDNTAAAITSASLASIQFVHGRHDTDSLALDIGEEMLELLSSLCVDDQYACFIFSLSKVVCVYVSKIDDEENQLLFIGQMDNL